MRGNPTVSVYCMGMHTNWILYHLCKGLLSGFLVQRGCYFTCIAKTNNVYDLGKIGLKIGGGGVLGSIFSLLNYGHITPRRDPSEAWNTKQDTHENNQNDLFFAFIHWFFSLFWWDLSTNEWKQKINNNKNWYNIHDEHTSNHNDICRHIFTILHVINANENYCMNEPKIIGLYPCGNFGTLVG